MTATTWSTAIAQFCIEQQTDESVRYLAGTTALPTTADCPCLVRSCLERGTPLCSYHRRLADGLVRKAQRAPSTYRELRNTFGNEYRRGYSEATQWLLKFGALVAGPGRDTRYQQAPRSAVTLDVQAGQLRQVAKAQPATDPFAMTPAALAAFVDGQTWRPGTRANYVKTLRAFYRWAHESGRIHTNPAADLSKDTQVPPRSLTGQTQRRQAPNPRGHNGHSPLELPPAWVEPANGWTAEMSAAGLSEATIYRRVYHLKMFGEHVNRSPLEVRRDDLIAWLAGMSHLAPNTRRNRRLDMTLFYRWLHESGLLTENPAAKIPKVRVPRSVPRPAPTDRITDAPSSPDPRARLAVRIMSETGIRCGECVSVHSDDVVSTPDGPVLRVTGKGGHTRHIPISDDLASTIRAARGYLFESELQAGTTITRHHLGKLVSQALGVSQGTNWTAHTLRHGYATRAYAGTGNLLAVRELLGHASVATAQGYTQVTGEAVRRTAEGAARL